MLLQSKKPQPTPYSSKNPIATPSVGEAPTPSSAGIMSATPSALV